MTPSAFNERRAAQAAAFLLFRAAGRLPFIKLIKLLYLAERRSFQQFGEALTGDYLVSMDHGPVLSRVYNHIKGASPSTEGGWDTWVADKEGYDVALRDPSMVRSPEQDLTHLSDSDLEVLESVWKEFGHWDRWRLIKYTHEHCPEWRDPHGSSIPIDHGVLFDALGFSAEQSQSLHEKLVEHAALENALNAA